MEEDRLETNLGPLVEEDLQPDLKPSPRQPRRRFVGRKAAEQLGYSANEESLKTSSVESMNDSNKGTFYANIPQQYRSRDARREHLIWFLPVF
jgi:hypothetical protein